MKPAITDAPFKRDPEGVLILHALDALEDRFPPLLYKRQPFWRPRPPACHQDITVPRYGWQRDGRGYPETVRVDINGAYLAPLSGTRFAHGALQHTKDAPYEGLPGYYRVDVPTWRYTGMPHPLGTADYDHRVWIAQPAMGLLAELYEAGALLEEPAVLDSWTCEETCRMAQWATWLRDLRLAAMHTDDKELYTAVKRGYAIATEMMLTGKQSKTYRPDWTHTITTQHAANCWRKGWKAHQAGLGPIEMSNVDEFVFEAADWDELVARERQYTDPKMIPFKIDPSGEKLGAAKIKEVVSSGRSR